jgi:hypothetical protein
MPRAMLAIAAVYSTGAAVLVDMLAALAQAT